MIMTMTKHAAIRQQQRCIPPLIIDWLKEYGDQQHDHHGCIVRFFSKESKKQLKKIAGKSIVGLLGRYMNTYLVEAIDGAVVTTGYRQRQIKR